MSSALRVSEGVQCFSSRESVFSPLLSASSLECKIWALKNLKDYLTSHTFARGEIVGIAARVNSYLQDKSIEKGGLLYATDFFGEAFVLSGDVEIKKIFMNFYPELTLEQKRSLVSTLGVNLEFLIESEGLCRFLGTNSYELMLEAGARDLSLLEDVLDQITCLLYTSSDVMPPLESLLMAKSGEKEAKRKIINFIISLVKEWSKPLKIDTLFLKDMLGKVYFEEFLKEKVSFAIHIFAFRGIAKGYSIFCEKFESLSGADKRELFCQLASIVYDSPLSAAERAAHMLVEVQSRYPFLREPSEQLINAFAKMVCRGINGEYALRCLFSFLGEQKYQELLVKTFVSICEAFLWSSPCVANICAAVENCGLNEMFLSFLNEE